MRRPEDPRLSRSLEWSTDDLSVAVQDHLASGGGLV
jgi:hypothetical protein